MVTVDKSTKYRLCRVNVLDGGLVEAKFASSSMAAIDQFYYQAEKGLPCQQTRQLRLLLDISKVPTLPVIYLVQQLRRIMAGYDYPLLLRIAVVASSESNLLRREIDQLVRSTQADGLIMVFSELEQAEAVRWALDKR